VGMRPPTARQRAPAWAVEAPQERGGWRECRCRSNRAARAVLLVRQPGAGERSGRRGRQRPLPAPVAAQQAPRVPAREATAAPGGGGGGGAGGVARAAARVPALGARAHPAPEGRGQAAREQGGAGAGGAGGGRRGVLRVPPEFKQCFSSDGEPQLVADRGRQCALHQVVAQDGCICFRLQEPAGQPPERAQLHLAGGRVEPRITNDSNPSANHQKTDKAPGRGS